MGYVELSPQQLAGWPQRPVRLDGDDADLGLPEADFHVHALHRACQLFCVAEIRIQEVVADQ